MKKGRPTPKAPQNRRTAPVTRPEPTPHEAASLRAAKARKAQRETVARVRSAFKGVVPIREAAYLLPQVRRQLAYLRNEAGRYARQDQAEARAARA